MVDHHVDRPGVEAVQAAQLTGTNRSIGLIHSRRNAEANRQPALLLNRNQKSETRSQKAHFWLLVSDFCPLVLVDLVVMARG